MLDIRDINVSSSDDAGGLIEIWRQACKGGIAKKLMVEVGAGGELDGEHSFLLTTE